MEKKHVFTCKEVPGAKRTSPKMYTHAIIGEWDYLKSIRMTQSPDSIKRLGSDWDYYNKCANASVVDIQFQWTKSHCCYDQETIDKGNEFIAKNPYRVAYIEETINKHVDEYEKAAKNIKRSVLGWSQSAVNAEKAAGGFRSRGYVNVSVVPAIQVK